MIPYRGIDSDEHIAASYSNTIVGTGFLAYRDLAMLINQYVNGITALDFGCGRGRSSQFLMSLGFKVEGIDICPFMIEQAKAHCLGADFFLVEECHNKFQQDGYDLVLAQLLLVDVSSIAAIDVVLKQQFNALAMGGVLIHTTTSDDFLKHQWASIDTTCKGNELVKNGQAGWITLKNRQLQLQSYCWEEDFLLRKFKEHGFSLLKVHHPMGQQEDPYLWQDEVLHSPYTIFVLQKS